MPERPDESHTLSALVLGSSNVLPSMIVFLVMLASSWWAVPSSNIPLDNRIVVLYDVFDFAAY